MPFFVRSIRALALVLPCIGCEKPTEPAATPAAEGERVSETATGAPSSAPSAPISEKRDEKPRFKPGAGSSDSTPNPEPASREERARAGRNTRGLVECGGSSCAPGKQACVGMSDWQCTLADAVPSTAEVSYYCDDGTDCPQGETCCLSFATASDSYVCSKRRGPETSCRVEVCAEGGARCPKGQVCSDGVCTSPERAASCGKNGRCPKARPICVWSPRQTACAAWEEFETSPGDEKAALRCTRRADCGPESRCCTNALWTATQCLTNCDAANEGEVCTNDADCTALAGPDRKGKCVSAASRDVASLPEWLKVCAYD